MKLVIFGLAISSSWGNGHATLWRGLCAALIAQGHRVVFFERDTEWYAAHRDLHHLPGGRRIERIWVKSRDAGSHWIWGAMRMPGSVLHDLHRLWCRGDRRDEYLGTLVNAWLASGGTASGVCAGAAYVDVGTLNGYRAALELLQARGESDPPVFAGAQLLAADQWRIAAAAAS